MQTGLAGRPHSDGILILDYGSQYTLLIARRLRELSVYAEIIDGRTAKKPDGFKAKGIILSGGPDSVYEEGSRRMPEWVVAEGVPVLGICYGMQLMTELFGGSVRAAKGREYGKATIHIEARGHGPWGEKLYASTPPTQVVWMSHGDDLAKCPDSCAIVAKSTDGVAAAIAHTEKPWIGLQYHPEVMHSEFGARLLQNFAVGICGVSNDWKPAAMIEGIAAEVKATVGNGTVLMAVSGGVDSTVAAVLLSKILGPEKVVPVFVDTGLLRKGERELVRDSLIKLGLNNLVILDRGEAFLSELKGLSDPEDKRKKIGAGFVREFEAFASTRNDFTHLGQGTLYPDVIESAGHGAGAKVIKTHHNVGGLPEKLKLKLVEPFRFLFKDEVRAIGRELGLASDVVDRHPFPGPGLAVRLPGEITAERVHILQEADAIYIEELRKAGYYDKVWQAFAVLLPVRTVGVMGDNRSYQWALSLRAVTGSDAMTAGVGDLPISFLSQVADRIVRKVPGINRVLYDVTTKPPATIEWE
jgi:GMP synthase (glutamine-hydrolysing)